MKKTISFFLIVIFTYLIIGCSITNPEVLDSSKSEDNFIITSDDTNKNNEVSRLQDEVENLKSIINLKNEKINELQEEMEKLENQRNSNNEDDNHFLKEERDYYRRFIDSYIDKLNEDELIKIAKNEWKYTLLIRKNTIEEPKEEIAIQNDGNIEINSSSFILTFAEHQPAFPILEKNIEIYNKGSLTGNSSDHLAILKYKDYTMYPSSGTIVDAITYEFKNVPKDTIIEIEITDQLRERLGLNNNKIIIKVNVDLKSAY